MSISELLGQIATLRVQALDSRGAWLTQTDTPADDGDGDTVLLPAYEVPAGTAKGDALRVFVHLDSEDRLIATLREPAIVLGEAAFLTVTALERFGAFFDWGLGKELLVPLREQTRELREGDIHPVALYIDDTGRLAGTMKVSELLATSGDFRVGEWVEGCAWRNEPYIGLFVILEKTTVGLVPATEPHRMRRGQAAQFRITRILPDGKLELSLRGPALEERDRDAEQILAALGGPNPPRLGDHSPPETLRAVLGLSKKAFKRAVGGLLRQGAVDIDAEGYVVLVRPPGEPRE